MGPGYHDEWSYSAIAGQRIMVAMDSEEVDAYLLVLGDDGTEVASDDDGGDGRNRRLEFWARATGRYTTSRDERHRRAERPLHDPGGAASRWRGGR